MKRAVADMCHHGPRTAEQTRGTAGNRIEDGLHIRLRLADHAQDLARRRLLLECLGQAPLEVPDPRAFALR